jgi:DNA-binding response OmpR family regulator
MFRHLNYIRELIDQLLDFRKMDQKIEQVNLAQIDLNQWLQDTIHEFDVLFRDREVHVQFDLDEQLPNVWFDREKLKRVVYNLLNNAFKYAPETRIIYVQTRSEDQERVVVSVADQGPGIPEDKKKKIFDRFYMLEKQQGATGIGLAYAKMLIELHGGNMGVENRDPSGAVFYFELPLGPTSETEGEEFSLKTPGKFASEEESISGDDQKQATSVDESFFHDLTMLVVEDDPELLSFLKESIVSVFKRVLTAQNGEEALAEVRNSYPDIVVSDVMMPVKDGWDLCRDIKSDLEISHIPVVLMTAKSDEQDLVKGYKLGADQYLTKPVSFDLLFSVVENLLKNRMMLKQRYQESSIQLKPADLTFSNADEAFLAKLNTIIEREIENPELSVDLLVDKMAMSRAALYNKLKAIVGTSINNYINKYRVNYAEALLKETDLSIADIAIKLGFSGQGYFSTLFRQFTDYSPRQFRKKFRPDASEGK